MSKTVKKLTIIALSVLLSILLFTAGALFNVKAVTATGNMQAYKEGLVKFEDRLWDASNYTMSSGKVIGVKGNTAFTNAIQATGSSLTADSYLTYSVDGAYCEAFFIDGATYKGQTTKVFVYVGIPAGASSLSQVPAVVCVHGGGGTAYSQWVQYWVERGYAAIAMDTEGCVPYEKTSNGYDITLGTCDSDGIADRHPYHHGPENPAFGDVNRNTPIDEQWFYQAVSAVIASRTFIGTFDQVDTSRIAITGISYGSYLTSITCAYDYRYCAAVPVYGSLEQQSTETYFGNNIRHNPYTAQVWDDGETLRDCPVPFFYIMGNMDNHFSVTSTTEMVKIQANTADMLIVNDFAHGHTPGSINGYGQANEVEIYINSVCNGTVGLPEITSHPTRIKSQLTYKLPTGLTFSSATLWYTENPFLINNALNINSDIYCDFTGQSKTTWNSLVIDAAYMTGNTINIPVPAGTKHYYVNITASDSQSKARSISTHVVAVEGEMPSYFYNLIRCQGTTNLGTNMPWASDNNGWHTYTQAWNDYYVRADATTTPTSYPMVMGAVSGTTYYNPYGVESATYSAGVSTLKFVNSGHLLNFNEFPVHKPIEFYYNYSSNDVFGDSWYTFSLFDNVDAAFAVVGNTWNPADSGAEFTMMGSNYTYPAVAGDASTDLNGRLRIYNADNTSGYATLTDASKLDSSNWNSQYYKVTIDIGESDTKVYVNDELIKTLTTKRSDFVRGMAYLHLQTAKAPLQFNFKYDDAPHYLAGSLSGAEFDYAMDQNGWSTYHQDTNVSWVDGTGAVVTSPVGSQQTHQYGSFAHSTAGSITQYQFDRSSYVINYNAFDVTKDITFSYNISTVNDYTTDYGTYYMISLFDSIDAAFKAGLDTWHGGNGAKVIMFGSNSNFGADGSDRASTYNKIKVTGTGVIDDGETNYTKTLFSDYSTTNWNKQWVKIVISIGESSTTYKIYGAEYFELTSTMKRSDFADGVAYLDFSTQAGCHVNFSMGDTDDAPLYVGTVGGLVFTEEYDANGFSNYLQQLNSQTIVDYTGATAIAVQYGRATKDVDANGYSKLTLNNSGWIVNGTAFDVSKPIRITYQATTNDVQNFYTFALFDDVKLAYLAGNETWNNAVGYKINMRATMTNQTMWESDLTFNTLKIGANGSAGYTPYSTAANSVYADGYTTSNWNQDTVIDIVIGTTKTAIVLNGVVYEINVKRSDFADGKAYLSVANYANVQMLAKVEQISTVKQNADVTLGEDIVFGYKVQLAGNYVEPSTSFTFRNKTTTINSGTFENGAYVFDFTGVTPQFISEKIDITVKATNLDTGAVETVATKEDYSVREYCEQLLSMYSYSDSPELVTLVVDFLNYGAAAQAYVGNTSDLANANIGAYQQYASDYSSLSAPNNVHSYTDGTGVEFNGAHLELSSNFDVVFEIGFSSAIKDATYVEFTIGGIKTTVAASEYTVSAYNTSIYNVAFKGITAKSFGDTIKVDVKNTSGTVLATATYSVNSFVDNIVDNAAEHSPALVNLAKAIYCYGVSANNF